MIPDTLLDEPMVQPIVASDKATGPELVSLLAKIRWARPYDSLLRTKLMGARSGGTKWRARG